jgi:putative DNA primase/helicase
MEPAIFKAVIAGDRLEARLPYQPPHFIRPSAGHIFSANEIPHTSDTSHGFFRRFITMKFERNFEDDPDRKTKTEIMGPLMEERGAIIMWALIGASRLIRRGEYPTVASHSDTVQNWKKSSCAVIDFVDSCLDVGVGATPLADLMAEFQEWAPTVGRSPRMKARTLSDRLVKSGMIKKRMGSGMVFPCSIRTTQNRQVAT